MGVEERPRDNGGAGLGVKVGSHASGHCLFTLETGVFLIGQQELVRAVSGWQMLGWACWRCWAFGAKASYFVEYGVLRTSCISLIRA
jgi:hypothetical protein